MPRFGGNEKRRTWALGLVLTGVVGLGCGDDGAGMAGSPTGQPDDDGSGSPPVMLDAPYGRCGGSMASRECAEAGAGVAECIERPGPQGISYSTCAILCMDDADCPSANGNISPECLGGDATTPGRCLLDCNTAMPNSCAVGTTCIEGEPSLCMWPNELPGHPDVQSFCETACGPCGSTLLLPWPMNCVEECIADLADCSGDEERSAFACTGGEQCPVGGGAVVTCLEPIECITGSA